MNKQDLSNDRISDLNKRLEVIISLLLKMLPKEGSLILKEQVQILSDLNLRPRDIANILGRSQKYIGKELSYINKKKKKV